MPAARIGARARHVDAQLTRDSPNPQQRAQHGAEAVQLEYAEPEGTCAPAWRVRSLRAHTPPDALTSRGVWAQVFKRLGFAVAKSDCERVVNAEPGEAAAACFTQFHCASETHCQRALSRAQAP